MRIACIGDNCIDEYRRLGRRYPTGNVVDTAVNLIKLGTPASVISTTGDDDYGIWMRKTLAQEGVDISHLKTGRGPTAVTHMDMNGTDRVHGEYQEGVLSHIVFDEEDIAFASEHDLVHSALWGKADSILPRLKENSVPVSFDYADRLDHPLVTSTLPFVDFGFFSYHEGRDRRIEDFLKDKVARGMKIATATLGAKGSLAWDGQTFWDGPVFPATVVNTVGAGDSFIAGFLHGLIRGCDLPECLRIGARIAADVIQVFEPWIIEQKG